MTKKSPMNSRMQLNHPMMIVIRNNYADDEENDYSGPILVDIVIVMNL